MISGRKKKIVILCMSCEQPFFRKQEEFLRTYSFGKDILYSDKYPNIDFYTYSASSDDKVHFHKNIHRIEVPCDDTLDGTFDKTQKTFQTLDALSIEYDYIFRTNCSTWVNLALLDLFVQGIPETDNKIYGSSIYCSENTAPEPYDYYVTGNALLIPRFWCDVIKTATIDNYRKYDRTRDGIYKDNPTFGIDDNAMGFVCNTYAELHNLDKEHIWGTFGDVFREDTSKVKYPEIAPYYIAIPIRCYTSEDRSIEFKAHKLVVDTFKSVYTESPEGTYNKLSKNTLYKLVDFTTSTGLYVNESRIQYFKTHLREFNYSAENFFRFCYRQMKEENV